MLITHYIFEEKISKNVNDIDAHKTSFLLSNKNLGYLLFSNSDKPRSRYEGVFFQMNNKPYRVVADIRRKDREIMEIVNKFYSVERRFDENREKFFMPYHMNSVAYELDDEEWISLILDVRDIYKIPEFGRFYNIFEENNTLVIRYTQEGEFDAFIAINGASEYKIIDKWELASYEFDRERNSMPHEIYVYNALKLKSDRVVISFSSERDSAIREAMYVYENFSMLEEKNKRMTEEFLMHRWNYVRNIKNDEIRFAYLCCLNSLYQLTTEDGIIAGLPWFFQYWTRDELISIINVDDEMKKKIIFRDLKMLMDDGRIPNIVQIPEIGNADSVGWLFKRINDLLGMFGIRERNMIRERVLESIGRLNNTYMKNGFLFNNKNETWMDTDFGCGGREGIRIEIQALFLIMFRLAFRLTRNDKFLELESILKKKIRREFWNNEILADGLGDFTIRPNIFIAAYVYPELLTRDEWRICFENSIPRLWCKWGGITTIDKKSKLFTKNHTGEFPKSYHRGDSWFFLNNMAALILYRVDGERFKEYIKKIIDASTLDILWNGCIGHHSELSSASKRESRGCMAQAWSNSLYIELIDEISAPDW